MAAWLIPALKAVLPHAGSIISAATPVFTRKRGDVDPAIVQEQIRELQAAATQNARHVRDIAEQLQRTVTALEQAAQIAEARLRRTYTLCVVAVTTALLSFAAALYTLAR